jgi:hypothetical protein
MMKMITFGFPLLIHPAIVMRARAPAMSRPGSGPTGRLTIKGMPESPIFPFFRLPGDSCGGGGLNKSIISQIY